jgi:endonuclease-3
LDRERVASKVITTLRKMYYTGARPGRDPETDDDAVEGPFKVLIATLLSHRTRDESTHRACKALFVKYDTPRALASAPIGRVEALIRPVGFYHVKARRIKQVSKLIMERFEGEVPDDIGMLLSIPGVGRKTANCVLVYGFGRDAIPVDTHVHRISNRLGLVRTKDPEGTEKELSKIFKKKDWQDVNRLFVVFGQRLCKPIGPRCPGCPFTFCPSRMV